MLTTAGVARGVGPAGPGLLVEAGGAGRFVSPAQIAASADTPARNYTLRAQPGESGQLDAHGGLSVRHLIEIAGHDPDAVGYLTVPRADGTSAYIPGADFADPPPYPEGPALVWVDVDSTHFFRPLRGAGDANASDNIAANGGETLTIGLHDGNLLAVNASAGDTDVERSQAVRFSATASGAIAGEQLSFRWSFGDGGSAAGAEASHAFSGSGTFRVVVTVTGDRDSGGQSSPVLVIVGDPPRRSAEGSAGKTETDGGRPASGGGGPTEAGAGIGGEVDSPGGRAAGHDDSGSTAGSDSAGPASAGGAGGDEGDGSSAPASTPAAEPDRGGDSAGEMVEGVLVSQSSPRRLPASLAAAVESADRPSVPSAPAAAGAGPPLLGVALAALLCGGAALELRGRRSRPR